MGVELGHNRNAFLGGARLWEIDPAYAQAEMARDRLTIAAHETLFLSPWRSGLAGLE